MAHVLRIVHTEIIKFTVMDNKTISFLKSSNANLALKFKTSLKPFLKTGSESCEVV